MLQEEIERSLRQRGSDGHSQEQPGRMPEQSGAHAVESQPLFIDAEPQGPDQAVVIPIESEAAIPSADQHLKQAAEAQPVAAGLEAPAASKDEVANHFTTTHIGDATSANEVMNALEDFDEGEMRRMLDDQRE